MTSTVDQNFEQLSYGGPTPSQHVGAGRKIIGDAVATRTLLAKEAGSLCLMDRAAGVVYTLPVVTASNVGMFFDFMTTVTITAAAAKTITGSAAQFILGTVFGYTTDATEIDGFIANGTTTGGVIGDCYRLTAISTTQWLITGHVFCGTATPATPFG